MDGHLLDRIAKTLSGSTSRRHTLGFIGAVLLSRSRPAAAATQIEIPTCGAAGDVCTLLYGCCSGLTCATSYLNPAYGVCVTGAGGLAPVSDSIVVPGSEGVEAALAQEVSAATAAAATTASTVATEDAERQARIDARRAKKDTRRSTQRSNRDTRGNTHQTNKRARRTTERTNQAPQLGLEFFLEVPPVATALADPLDTPPATHPQADPPKGLPEIVRIRNYGDLDVLVSRIESMQQPHLFSTSSVTIPAGGTYLLQSGKYVPTTAPANTSIWTKENVCPSGGGVTLTAAQAGSTVTHQFSVVCGGTASFVTPETTNPQQRKNTNQQQQNQARRRKKHQKRKDRQRAKHHKGGKGS